MCELEWCPITGDSGPGPEHQVPEELRPFVDPGPAGFDGMGAPHYRPGAPPALSEAEADRLVGPWTGA